MPQIVDKTYFQNANELNIPLSVQTLVANPTLNTPNESTYLDNLCVKIERSVLLSALGLATYNELQLALQDLDNPVNASYKKLVQGDEYDGKIWVGLDNDYSLIAYRIFEEYLTETNVRLVVNGNVQLNPEKASLLSPAFKIANANQKFIEQYQSGYLNEPIIIDNFIDWFGSNNETFVSLYTYLIDKKADFPNWDLSKFAVYTTKNSFGL